MKKYLILLLFAFLPSLLLAQAAGGAIKRPVKKQTTSTTTKKKETKRQSNCTIQQEQQVRETQPVGICPDSNHPHAIDLGLPSGTLWSCCNVGAKKPEGYGGYYAWGETKTKRVYDYDTYQYGRSTDDFDDIGSDIAGTQYDAATANWGATWKMPTKVQWEELIENTTSKWTTHNGVKGRTITSKKNGCIIFLPAGGWYADELYAGEFFEDGFYMSSSLNVDDPGKMWVFVFNKGVPKAGPLTRVFGFFVRPVR